MKILPPPAADFDADERSEIPYKGDFQRDPDLTRGVKPHLADLDIVNMYTEQPFREKDPGEGNIYAKIRNALNVDFLSTYQLAEMLAKFRGHHTCIFDHHDILNNVLVKEYHLPKGMTKISKFLNTLPIKTRKLEGHEFNVIFHSVHSPSFYIIRDSYDDWVVEVLH